MPFRSKAQQRFMFAAEARGELPKGMARRWAAHTPDMRALPDSQDESETQRKEGSSMPTITELAARAVEIHHVEKLAADSEITPDLVRHFAGSLGLSPTVFVKRAYADPKRYVEFLKAATTKQALGGDTGQVLQYLMKAIRARAGQAGGAISGAAGGIGGAVRNNPLTSAGVAGGLGMAGVAGTKMMSGAQSPAPAAPQAPAGGVMGDTGGADLPGLGGAPKPEMPQAPTGSSMMPGKGALLTGLGLGGAGVGAGMMMGKAKAKKKAKKPGVAEKESHDLAIRAAYRAVEKKAAEVRRHNARVILNAHLDQIANAVPVEKQASFRVIQAEVSRGQNLAYAIKAAFPRLSGEQRGAFALGLVRSALRAHHTKQAALKRAALFGKDKDKNRRAAITEPSSKSVPIDKAPQALRAMSS